MGELLVDRAGHDDRRRPRGPLRDQPGEGEQHRRHPALDVARPPAVEPAALHDGPERVDRHAVGRHGVLVGVEEDRPFRVRRLVPREDVVAPGAIVLPLDSGRLSSRNQRLEIVGHPPLRGTGPVEGPAHRVDAGDGDEVGQQAGHGVQGAAPRCESAVAGSRADLHRRGRAASADATRPRGPPAARRGAMLAWKDDDRIAPVATFGTASRLSGPGTGGSTPRTHEIRGP